MNMKINKLRPILCLLMQLTITFTCSLSIQYHLGHQAAKDLEDSHHLLIGMMTVYFVCVTYSLQAKLITTLQTLLHHAHHLHFSHKQDIQLHVQI